MGFLRRARANTAASSSTTSASASASTSSTASATPTPGVFRANTFSGPDPVPGVTRANTFHPTSSPTPSHAHKLSLPKVLTWSGLKRGRHRRRIEEWEREDQNEWDAPTARRGVGGRSRGVASKQHQEMLRAFAFGCNEEGGRRRHPRPASVFSGISPGCSRSNSVDGGRPSQCAES